MSTSDGERFALQHNMMTFIETSAKDGRNVDTAFYRLAQVLHIVWSIILSFLIICQCVVSGR